MLASRRITLTIQRTIISPDSKATFDQNTSIAEFIPWLACERAEADGSPSDANTRSVLEETDSPP
jgi:hypothetical protein